MFKVNAAQRLTQVRVAAATFADTATVKEMAVHMRDALKDLGIKTKLKVYTGTSRTPGNIVISTPSFAIDFSDDEQRAIRKLAKSLGLTNVRGTEIDIDRMTDPQHFAFYMPHSR